MHYATEVRIVRHLWSTERNNLAHTLASLTNAVISPYSRSVLHVRVHWCTSWGACMRACMCVCRHLVVWMSALVSICNVEWSNYLKDVLIYIERTLYIQPGHSALQCNVS